MTNARIFSWQRIFIYVLPAALFLSATLPNLNLPGIQYDELYYVPPAAALLKEQYDMDYVKIDPSVLPLFGKPFPLMFNYYTSFLRTYLTLPAFALWGINVVTVRGSSLAWATIALLFFIAFARRLTGRAEIALVSGILLALDASFIAYTHNDYVAVSLMMALKGAGLWALLRWWQERELKWLALGAFMIGLGLTDRASFLWIPLALAPALVLLYGRTSWRALQKRLPQRKHWLVASAAFALGAGIFLAFNIATLGGTFTPMASNFRQTSGGADNLNFFANLHLRVQMLIEVLGGGYLNHFINGETTYQTSGWNFAGSPMAWLAPLAFVYYAAKATMRTLARAVVNRAVVFALAMSAALLFFTCFTPTLHRGHQLLMLYPFPQILVALFLFEMLLRQRVLLRFSAAVMERLLVLMMIIVSLAMTRPVLAYHQLLMQTGGRGVWSDAIYEIVAEADAHPERTIVCMDWGFNANLLALTKQRVRTVRNYETTRRTPEQLARLFDKQHAFLLHAPEYTYIAGAREDFFAAVEYAQAAIDTLRVFHQREGQPVAYLVSVSQPEGRSDGVLE